MAPLLDRIKERKVAQWTGAYIASAWVLVEVVDVVAQWWAWPAAVVRAIQVLLAFGLPFAVTLAWYHGEKGRQRFSTPEPPHHHAPRPDRGRHDPGARASHRLERR